MTVFAFLDVETTGLDPVDNHILEVAWQLTDSHFEAIGEPKTFLVDHAGIEEDVLWQIDKSPFLTKMHSDSGLRADWVHERNKPRMNDIIEEFVRDALIARDGEDHVRLAGYSVSFDREFLRENGWRNLFESPFYGFQMHHRILDLSSVIQMFDGAERPVPSTYNNNPHRALDDALDSLELAQLIRDELRVL